MGPYLAQKYRSTLLLNLEVRLRGRFAYLDKLGLTMDTLFWEKQEADSICQHHILNMYHVYRVVQKKGTVLLSTSLAWPAVAGCSRAETFTQLSSIYFAQPCNRSPKKWLAFLILVADSLNFCKASINGLSALLNPPYTENASLHIKERNISWKPISPRRFFGMYWIWLPGYAGGFSTPQHFLPAAKQSRSYRGPILLLLSSIRESSNPEFLWNCNLLTTSFKRPWVPK